MSDNIAFLTMALIWLDDSTNNSEEHTATEQQLRHLDDNLKTYQNQKTCEDYIKSQPENAHIVLIVNGKLGQQIVPIVHDLAQIISIYVYCINKEYHEQWVKPYTKVKGVIVDFNKLKQQIQIDHGGQNNLIIDESLPTDIPQRNNIQIQSTYGLDCSYLIADSCFDYLVRMKPTPTEKDEFISLCQAAFQGNEQKLPILGEFQEGYSSDRAISWLNRDPFFPLIIDNVFNLIHIDAMFQCRVFIRDIQKQLEQHKCKSTIQVYRSQLISNENFETLKNSVGKIIAMKSFLFTTLDREIALFYASDSNSSNESKRILFTIEANPQLQNVKPFAKIDSSNNCNDSDEIMFMIGSLFKITEIQDEKDGIINIKMVLCETDDSSALKISFDQFKHRYIDSQGETDVIGFGQLLCDIGHSLGATEISDTGEKYIRSCLEKLAADHPDRSRCYDKLGNIDSFKGNLDASLDWYKKSFEIKKQKLQSNDLQLAESYQNIGLVCLRKGDNSQALENFKQLLLFFKQIYDDDHISLIGCYTNMAIIHQNEERLPEAISFYYRALAIMIKYDSIDEGSLAAVYNNLGNVHTCLKSYHLALGYYKTSLEMKLALLSTVDPSIATTYKNIGLVYGYMDKIQQSRENLEKTAEIYRQLYPSDHPNVLEIEELIRNLSTLSE